MKWFPAPLGLLAIASCATAEPVSAPRRLPTSEEVMTFIRANWEEDYSVRFGRLTGGQSEKLVLVDVTNVECGYYYAYPECSYDIEARFTDGIAKKLRLNDTLDWDEAGQLESVIVLHHPRRK